MKTISKSFVIAGFVAALMLAGCSSEQKKPANFPPKLQVTALDRLTDWITGSFQSLGAESTSGDTLLYMARIWPNRPDGYWLYVEQESASDPDHPFRQQVYCVTTVNDTTFRSDVFALPDPGRFAGDWQTDDPLDPLTADSLTPQPGCSLVLHPKGDSAFVGNTEGGNCPESGSAAVARIFLSGKGVGLWSGAGVADSTRVAPSRTGGLWLQRLNNEPTPDTTTTP